MPMTNAPVIDGEFVLGDAEVILQNKTSSVYRFFSSLDYMVGALSGDGIDTDTVNIFIPEDVLRSYNSTYERGFPTAALCNYIAPLLARELFAGKTEIANRICSIYSNGSSFQAQSNMVVELFSDVIYTFPAILSADLHAGRTSTYVYYMTHADLAMPYILPVSYSWLTHPQHGADVIYLFSPELFQAFHMPDEVKLGVKMQMYWTNFAKTG